MTKRKVRQLEPEDAPEELGRLDPDSPIIDSSGIENVLRQLGEAPGDAKVHVHRMRQGMRPPFAFLYGTTAAEFSIEDLKARYGGGEFLIRCWQRGIEGFSVNERVAIEGEPIVANTAPKTIQLAAPQAGGGPSFITLPQQGGDAIGALAGIFAQSIDRLGAMLVQTQASNRGGMREALELLTVAKALVGPPQGAGDPQGMLSLVSQLMGIMREAQPLAGEGGKADGWSTLQTAVDKLLPAIVARLPLNGQPVALPGPVAIGKGGAGGEIFNFPLVGGGGAGQGPNVSPTVAHGGPMPGSLAEAAALASQPAAPAPETARIFGADPMPMLDPKVAALFLTYSQMFVQAASINADPGAYADTIVDMIDAAPGSETAVRTFLARPDWLELLVRHVPAAAAHRDWFTQLAADILEALNAPEEDASDLADPENQHYRENT